MNMLMGCLDGVMKNWDLYGELSTVVATLQHRLNYYKTDAVKYWT